MEEVEVDDDDEEGYEYIDGGDSVSSSDGYEDEEVEEVPAKTRFESGVDGEPGWTNAEGDRLRDFGVDEDAEEEDDEDVPLGELLRRRRAYQGVEA